MRADRKTLFARLKALGIETVTVEHAPVFTVAQSGVLREMLPGAHTKSLFVVDKEGRMVLVVAKDDTRVDLKALAKHLGIGRLSFGKPELLEAVLGHAVRAHQRERCRCHGRGREGADGFRRGQLPSAREHGDHSARDARAAAIYCRFWPRAARACAVTRCSGHACGTSCQTRRGSPSLRTDPPDIRRVAVLLSPAQAAPGRQGA
jgi:hypothetical protein